MSVRVDAHRAAMLQGCPVPAPIQVKAPRVGIYLDRDAVFGAGAKNFIDINVVSGAAKQLPTCHVAKDRSVGICDGPHDPIRLFLAA